MPRWLPRNRPLSFCSPPKRRGCCRSACLGTATRGASAQHERSTLNYLLKLYVPNVFYVCQQTRVCALATPLFTISGFPSCSRLRDVGLKKLVLMVVCVASRVFQQMQNLLMVASLGGRKGPQKVQAGLYVRRHPREKADKSLYCTVRLFLGAGVGGSFIVTWRQ